MRAIRVLMLAGAVAATIGLLSLGPNVGERVKEPQPADPLSEVRATNSTWSESRVIMLPPAPINTSAQSTARPTSYEQMPLDAVMRDVATSYLRYFLANPVVHWSPALCSAPPTAAQRSQSGDTTPHGQKLYYLFIKDANAYVAVLAAGGWNSVDVPSPQGGRVAFPSDSPAPLAPVPQIGTGQPSGATPVGQVLVKEAWHVARVQRGTQVAAVRHACGRIVAPYAEGEDGTFSATELAGLFIMVKLPPETENTDQGWAYGTTTADGTVTSAGRIESCIHCHRDAPYDRQFGPQSVGR
jgi:hypothetical protein